MRAKHSQMNGEECLLVHCADPWCEVREVIAEVDAESCRSKVSREKTMRGKTLHSPQDMNKAFKAGFEKRGSP